MSDDYFNLDENESDSQIQIKPKIIKEPKVNKPHKIKEPKPESEPVSKPNFELEMKITRLETKIQQLEQQPPHTQDTFENKLKELNVEQQKLQSQIQLLVSFENALKSFKPTNNSLTYFDTYSVIQYIKHTLHLDLDDNQLNSLKKVQSLPNWNDCTTDQKEMLMVLIRCLKDGRSFERFNKIQLKMNEEKKI